MSTLHHRCRLLLLSLILIGWWSPAPIFAQETAREAEQEETKLPPPLTEYFGRKIAQTMHYTGAPWLTRESREREEDCQTLLRELRVKPGQRVCDLGCGNGFYTLQLAERVGEKGKVLAVDIQPEMLELLKKRAEEEDLTERIQPILGTVADPKLPDDSVDLVLFIDVYHELAYPEQILAKIRSALKPGGLLVLAEFRLEDPEVPIKLLHKMSKEQIDKEMRANGFRLARSFDDLPWQHLVFYEVDEDREPAKR
ncbi:MAG: class I SAM-dependent methyltransferase [Planctomycetota bacterium]